MNNLARAALRRLTYANVMSTIAVVAALSGGLAFAALAKNSVGSTQVIDNSLAARDLATSAVGSAELATGSVTAADLGANSVSSAKIEDDSITSSDLLDGPASGVDADTLDGSHASAFQQRGATLECNAGDVISAIDASGAPTCVSNTTLPAAYVTNGAGMVTATGEPRDVVISKQIPAGSYAIWFSGDAYNPSGMTGDERGYNCVVELDGSNVGNIAASILGLNDVVKPATNKELFSIVGTGTTATTATLALACIAPVGNVSINGHLVAVRVGSIS